MQVRAAIACNASGKLLKAVDMQYRYGVQDRKTKRKVLDLLPVT